MIAANCAGCGRTDGFITDCSEGIVVCKFCGRVKECCLTDDSGELTSFSKDCSEFGLNDTRRVGGPSNPLLLGNGLGTLISTDKSNLARWGQRIPDSRLDTALIKGFKTLDEYCHLLNLSQVVSFHCKEVFKKCYTAKKTSRLQSLDALLAAIVFYICRRQGINKSIEEILEVIPANYKILLNMYREVKEVLELRKSADVLLQTTARYAAKLQLPEVVCKAATAIAKLASCQGYADSHNPGIIAATAVYMASKTSKEPHSLSGVARIAKVTEATLKGSYKDLMPLRDQLAEHIDASLDPCLLNGTN